MIVFDLKCDAAHVFEAWFRSSDDFERQQALGLVVCPHCGSTSATKAVMAPNVSAKSNTKTDAPSVTAEPISPAAAAEAMPSPSAVPSPAAPSKTTASDPVSATLPSAVGVAQATRHMLRQIKQHVETTCENVGTNFAEEARKIHYGESEERGIYGRTTAEESTALQEEGIPFLSLADDIKSDA